MTSTNPLSIGELRESLQCDLQDYAYDSKLLDQLLLPRSHQQNVGASALAASYLQVRIDERSVPSEMTVVTHLEALKAHLVARRDELDEKKRAAAVQLDAVAAMAAAPAEAAAPAAEAVLANVNQSGGGSSSSSAAAGPTPLSQLSAALAALPPPPSRSSDGWVSAAGFAPTQIDMLEEAGLIERHPDGLGRVRKDPHLRLPWD